MKIRRTPKPDGRIPFSALPFDCVFTTDGKHYYIRITDVVYAVNCQNAEALVRNAIQCNNHAVVRFGLDERVILCPDAELCPDGAPEEKAQGGDG